LVRMRSPVRIRIAAPEKSIDKVDAFLHDINPSRDSWYHAERYYIIAIYEIHHIVRYRMLIDSCKTAKENNKNNSFKNAPLISEVIRPETLIARFSGMFLFFSL